MTDTKNWYASKTVWTVLIMLVSVFARNFGVDLGPFEAEMSDLVLDLVTVTAGAVALWSRVTASKRLTS
jgi:hypothetical protein